VIKENYRLTLAKRAERVRPVSTDTVQKIIELTDAETALHLVRDVIRIVANTGLMNCELLPLRITDIDEERKRIAVGQARARRCAQRILPVRQKTLESIFSLHQMHPESQFIFGDVPRYPFTRVIDLLRLRFPDVALGRLFLYSIRMNFVHRLILAGVPLGVAKYWLGQHDLLHMMPSLGLSGDQKLEIVRRNIENFMIEL
jgi:integrase